AEFGTKLVTVAVPHPREVGVETWTLRDRVRVRGAPDIPHAARAVSRKESRHRWEKVMSDPTLETEFFFGVVIWKITFRRHRRNQKVIASITGAQMQEQPWRKSVIVI